MCIGHLGFEEVMPRLEAANVGLGHTGTQLFLLDSEVVERSIDGCGELVKKSETMHLMMFAFNMSAQFVAQFVALKARKMVSLKDVHLAHGEGIRGLLVLFKRA